LNPITDFFEQAEENIFFEYMEPEIAICDYRTMTSKQFFLEHVAKQRPCLFKEYAKEWPAYHKWRNVTYLKEKAGEEIIYAERQQDNRFAYFTEGARRVFMTYGDFLDKFGEENRTYHYYYSFEDPPGPLKKDIIEPQLTASVLKIQQITFWHGFGTATKAHTDAMENIICVFEGYKNFTFVSPYHRGFTYAGYGGLPDNYSPVDFNNPDCEKWPLFKKAKLGFAHIAQGDCLFMPAYWFHQVTSSPGVCLAISHWYHTHHNIVDVAMFGMQEGII